MDPYTKRLIEAVTLIIADQLEPRAEIGYDELEIALLRVRNHCTIRLNEYAMTEETK